MNAPVRAALASAVLVACAGCARERSSIADYPLGAEGGGARTPTFSSSIEDAPGRSAPAVGDGSLSEAELCDRLSRGIDVDVAYVPMGVAIDLEADSPQYASGLRSTARYLEDALTEGGDLSVAEPRPGEPGCGFHALRGHAVNVRVEPIGEAYRVVVTTTDESAVEGLREAAKDFVRKAE